MFGIRDVNDFYADKFVWNHPINIVENDPLSKFDIAYFKQYWIYNNIRNGSRVLDVGCGSGTLNLLKSKDVYLVGTDLSEKCLEQALLAGYDEAILCDCFDVPYPDNSFDFVVSLDVLGHIENEIKDIYLKEWKRLLNADGVMLHGIEAADVDYSKVTDKEKEHFMIDGHVGLESFEKVEERFSNLFNDVKAENFMGLCYNWHDIQKYPITEDRVGKEVRDYLLTFNMEQIKGFNAAMLLMRNLLSKDGLLGKSGGFMFVSAKGKKAG
jgi:ubiquinone/menaquinone biosynthesis C-methylase UbiE